MYCKTVTVKCAVLKPIGKSERSHERSRDSRQMFTKKKSKLLQITPPCSIELDLNTQHFLFFLQYLLSKRLTIHVAASDSPLQLRLCQPELLCYLLLCAIYTWTDWKSLEYKHANNRVQLKNIVSFAENRHMQIVC